MLFTLVALSPFLALNRGPTSIQRLDVASKISVVLVISVPLKPPVTKYL